MNLPLFIAKRIYNGPDISKQVSRPAVIISMIGIAIGLAVMIIAVSVITGFKSEIRSKVTGFSSHLLVTDVNAVIGSESTPIIYNDSLQSLLTAHPQVKHVQRYSQKAGMMKTADAFQGIVAKGIDSDYQTDFLRQHIIQGELAQFSDTVSTNTVLISKVLADKLQLNVGDKVDTYFFDESIRARKWVVSGIYETHFSAFDGLYVFTDLYTVNRLNHWDVDEASGIEIALRDDGSLEQTTFELGTLLNDFSDRNGTHYGVVNVEQQNPAVFSWLEVLDVNIWVILVLMIGIAGFTMIAGLLIIILERTNFIAVMKSLGATNSQLRHIFLHFAALLVGRGLLIGNILGVGLTLLQKYTGLVHLDPATYYVDVVPMQISWPLILLLNVATLIITVLVLILPSFLVSRIEPARVMRFE